MLHRTIEKIDFHDIAGLYKVTVLLHLSYAILFVCIKVLELLVSFFHSKLYRGRPNYEISRDLQEKEDLLLLTFYHSSRVCCARRHIQLWRGVIVELMRQTNERVRGCINRFYNSSGVLHVVVPKLHVCTTVSPTSTKCGTIFLKLGLSTANSFRQKVYLSSKKLQNFFVQQ